MKNLNMFGSGDSWGRFLYQQYSPGNRVTADGEQESDKITIAEGTGNIGEGECDNKREVATPWDTPSQNKLLNALATEIQKGGNVEAIIAKAGNTLGQIAFGMKKAGKGADIGWGTKVQYFDAELNPQGEPMALAEANALKPEWKVLFKEAEVDGKTVTKIEVIMDTETTEAQLDALRNKVTKNIECDEKGKPIVTEDEEDEEVITEDEEPVVEDELVEEEETEDEEVVDISNVETAEDLEALPEDVKNKILDSFWKQLKDDLTVKNKLNTDRSRALYDRGDAEPMFVLKENGKLKVRRQKGHFFPGGKKLVDFFKKEEAVDVEIPLNEWLTAQGFENLPVGEFSKFLNTVPSMKYIQLKAQELDFVGSMEEEALEKPIMESIPSETVVTEQTSENIVGPDVTGEDLGNDQIPVIPVTTTEAVSTDEEDSELNIGNDEIPAIEAATVVKQSVIVEKADGKEYQAFDLPEIHENYTEQDKKEIEQFNAEFKAWIENDIRELKDKEEELAETEEILRKAEADYEEAKKTGDRFEIFSAEPDMERFQRDSAEDMKKFFANSLKDQIKMYEGFKKNVRRGNLGTLMINHHTYTFMKNAKKVEK